MRLRKLRTFGALATTGLVVAGTGLAATAVAAPGHHRDRGGRYVTFFPGHRGHRASTLYVAPTGVSTNNGTSCAQATYATIQAAVTAAADRGVTLPSHNGLAVDPTTLAPAPSLAGVYGNTVSNNTIVSNGLKGFGAGVVIAAPFPGSASYDNVVSHNLIEGNGLAGVTLHSHAPGAFVGGNQILWNTIGVNDLTGDTPLSPATGPFAAPVQFQADTQTTGILVWSLATPTSVTIANNTILGDAIGIWLNPTVTAAGASTNNAFYGVTTAVGP